MIKIYNTLTKQKETFKPIEENKVRMYVCGPTVYNLIHIGNARPYIVFDTVRRYFEAIGYDVNYVQNFTDVDDKIINKANEEGRSTTELVEEYISETLQDAKNLNVKLIVEGANGPTTPEADEILNEKNIEVIPDILANSGGVLVSYYEWVQNQYGYYWTQEDVQEKQEKDMLKAIEGIYELKIEYKTNIRQAAYMYAIKRIAEAMELRGWI